MANKTITMLQLRRIIQLKAQGKSNREIARELHLARDTVNGYVKQLIFINKSHKQLLDCDNQELASLLLNESSIVKKDHRYDDLMHLLPSLCDELNKAKVTRMVLYEEYRLRRPDGYSYTQFCEHISRFLETRKAVMHFNHEPGAVMMFDFAGDKLPLVDKETGEITKCPVLVCTLPFSAYVYAEALPSANRQYLLKALNNALEYFGGVPQSVKTDNLAQIVKKSNRYEPAFDELAEQWSLHYNTTLMATRVRKPRDKASAESHVNVVYNRVYAPIRNEVFNHIAQMNQAIWFYVDKLNDRKLQGCDYTRRERFELYEKPLLQALALHKFIPKTKIIAKVQRNYHITLGQDMHHYSVPYQVISKKVDVVYDTDNVEIYHKTIRIACHKRNYQRNGYSTIMEHMPPSHKHYTRMKGWNQEYFIEKASLIGENTRETIQKILEQKIFIEQTYNSCLGVLRLGDKYGNDRLEAACKRAIIGYKVTYTIIKNILARNLDKVPIQSSLCFHIPEHDNIRGPETYQ